MFCSQRYRGRPDPPIIVERRKRRALFLCLGQIIIPLYYIFSVIRYGLWDIEGKYNELSIDQKDVESICESALNIDFQSFYKIMDITIESGEISLDTSPNDSALSSSSQTVCIKGLKHFQTRGLIL